MYNKSSTILYFTFYDYGKILYFISVDIKIQIAASQHPMHKCNKLGVC